MSSAIYITRTGDCHHHFLIVLKVSKINRDKLLLRGELDGTRKLLRRKWGYIKYMWWTPRIFIRLNLRINPYFLYVIISRSLTLINLDSNRISLFYQYIVNTAIHMSTFLCLQDWIRDRVRKKSQINFSFCLNFRKRTCKDEQDERIWIYAMTKIPLVAGWLPNLYEAKESGGER